MFNDILRFILLIAVIAAIPIGMIWSLNTLLPVAIGYGILEYSAAFFIYFFFGGPTKGN